MQRPCCCRDHRHVEVRVREGPVETPVDPELPDVETPSRISRSEGSGIACPFERDGETSRIPDSMVTVGVAERCAEAPVDVIAAALGWDHLRHPSPGPWGR